MPLWYALLLALAVAGWFVLLLWPLGFWYGFQFLIVGAFSIGVAAIASSYIGAANAKWLLYALIPIGFVVAYVVTKTLVRYGHRGRAAERSKTAVLPEHLRDAATPKRLSVLASGQENRVP
jgi:hypothetical protein